MTLAWNSVSLAFLLLPLAAAVACESSDGGGDSTDGAADSTDGAAGSTTSGETSSGTGWTGSTGSGGDSGTGTSGGSASTGGFETAGATDSDGGSSQWPDIPQTPGVHGITVIHEGLERRLDLAIPMGLGADGPAPLVFVLHGAGGSGPAFRMQHAAVAQLAVDQGWVLIYPNALFSEQTNKSRWNYDNALGAANDVGFLVDAAQTIGAALQLDRDRVFVTGFSNGAKMTHHLVALHPDVFAAGAPVAGNIGTRVAETSDEGLAAEPTGPVPMLMANGSNDPSVPWDGGPAEGGFAASVQDQIDRWVQANGCDATAAREPFTMGEGYTDRWTTNCADGTEVIQVRYGSSQHIWPDPGDVQGWDASTAVLDFFARH